MNNYWSTLLRNVVDDQLPLKKMRVRDKDVPYMTIGWKQAIRAKGRATMKYKNHPTQENWETHGTFLKHLGHSYQQRVTRVRSRFILELMAMSYKKIKAGSQICSLITLPRLLMVLGVIKVN